MNRETREKLNRINKRFYQEAAGEFSQSRAKSWVGWERLLEFFHQQSFESGRLRVLDVGCGNGRFGSFLRANLEVRFEYVGVDSSFKLLKIADKKLGEGEFEWVEGDVVESSIGEVVNGKKFDVVALFGMMHHIPGLEKRRQLLLEAVNLLDEGGLLMVSFWQFMEFDRFRKKIIPWSEYAKYSKEVINAGQLEKGDVILGWGNQQDLVRYCHHVDGEEIEELINKTGLKKVADFRADGKSAKSNRYLILRK